MMLSFSKHTGASDGAGRRAVAYLLADEWTKTVDDQRVIEHRIPPPEILRGDPRLVQAAIEAAPGALKYTMAVASFHPGDVDVARFNSGDERERAKVNAYIDDWQAAAFSGLPRASWPPHLISTHTHTGRLEINLLIPRAIMVGDRLKSHNVAPPGPASRRLFNALEDLHNSRNGWADPRDSARERAVKVPDFELKERAARSRVDALTSLDGGASGIRPTSRKDIRQVIADQLARQIDAGRVTNRDQVVEHLVGAGFQVSRATKKSITLLDPADDKRIRLEGPIFRSDFSAPRYLAERRRATPEGATEREWQRLEYLWTAEERLRKELAFRAETNSALAAQIAAAAPPVEPVDLTADRIHFRRLPDMEPAAILEFDDDRGRDRDRVSGRVGSDFEHETHAPGRARPAPGRGRAPAVDRAARARADRPGRAPGRPGALPLPDPVRARKNRAGAVFESKDSLRILSRRHLDQRLQISASILSSDARDHLDDRGPTKLDEMRRRSQRDRRLSSQSARLARSEWSLEKRTEWKQKYLDRLYSGPPLDSSLLLDIRYIDPRAREIQFWDGCTVRDEGDRIVADWATQSSIELLVAQARAAGWNSVRFTGRDRDVAALVAEAHRQGLTVEGHPAQPPAPSPTAEGAQARPAHEEFSPMATSTAPIQPKPRRPRQPQFVKDPPGYIDRIKKEVDLPSLAAGYGYERDPEKSTQRWLSMRHRETGRRLLISRDDTGQWKWQDAITKQGGDAFHLVADARSLDPKRDFSAIKKELAGLVGSSPADFTPPPPRPPASIATPESSRDFLEIRAAWEAAGRDPVPAYLKKDRSIPRPVLQDPRFIDTHRQVSAETAFPYFDVEGALVGYERRRTPTSPDQPKASYARGGAAGLWQSNKTPNDDALVICESPIDCMSHYTLLQPDRRPTVRYAALRQGREANAALRAAIASMPAGSKIVGACDHGTAGQRYQDEIEALAAEYVHEFVDHRPADKKRDWNDELRARARDVRRALELRDHLDREAQAATPAPPERPVQPAAATIPEEQRRAEIEELEEDDGPAPGM
jgi:hypothetical protein